MHNEKVDPELSFHTSGVDGEEVHLLHIAVENWLAANSWKCEVLQRG